MNYIWKYTLKAMHTTLAIPKGGNILSVQFQGNEIVMWVLVDPVMEKVNRNIIMFWTGEIISDTEGLDYLGTVQTDLVYHVFELVI